MPTVRTTLLLTLLAALGFSLPAQQPVQSPTASLSSSPDDAQPVPTLHVTARTVILDVVVTDGNGNPVKGLKSSDFALTEDGALQKLTGFDEHDASSIPLAPPQPPLPPNTFAVQPPPPESVTKTVIVLDQLHYPDFPYTRADILAFMKTLPPGNPIAIIRLDWQGLHLVQNFTSDPQLLQRVVAGPRILPALPPLNVQTWNHCQPPYRGVADPYHRLARYIAGIPGRINLAWVTDEGMEDAHLGQEYPDLSNFAGNLGGSTGVLRLSRVSFYAIKANGYIGGMLAPLSAPDIPVPHIIPKGISHSDPIPDSCPVMPAATGGLFANQALADMATSLGGHAFFDGAAKALTQILALGSDYYTLSYVPSNPNWNGAYRKIAIGVSRTPTTRASLFGWSAYGQPKLVYRRGYYARSKPDPRLASGSETFGPDTPSSPERKLISTSLPGGLHRDSAMQAAMGFGVATPAQLNFTVQIIPSPQAEKRSRGAPLAKDIFLAAPFRGLPYRNLQIHYWLDPADLKFTRTPAGLFRDDLQFVAIVYGDDGLVVNSISASTHIQASAQNLETVLVNGVTLDQTVAIPIKSDAIAGDFVLRAGVLEPSTGHIGVLEVPTAQISIPPAPTVADTTPHP